MSRRDSFPGSRRLAVAAATAVGAVGGLAPGVASAATLTFENPTPISITDPPSGPATPYPSTINVSGFSGPVEDVDATIMNLSHGEASDVDVLLVGPGGQKTLLISDTIRVGAAAGVTATLDDEAAGPYPCVVMGPAPSGSFKPSNDQCHSETDAFNAPAPGGPYPVSLAVFDGTDPNGDWKLYVLDDTLGAAGSIADGWSLTLTAEAPPPAKADRTLTFDLNKAKVKKGKKVRGSGHLEAVGDDPACEASQTVEVLRDGLKRGAPQVVATLTTDAQGNYSTTLKVRKTSRYSAHAPETGQCLAGNSDGERVKVKKPKAKKTKKPTKPAY